MSYSVTIKLRKHEYEIEIDHDSGYEYDTNTHDIEWHWVDDPPPNITMHEDDLIWLQIYEASNDRTQDKGDYDER